MSRKEKPPRESRPDAWAQVDAEPIDLGQIPPPMSVVGNSASAGSPASLKKLFTSVPVKSVFRFVVVAGLYAALESHLAPRLQSQGRFPVQQATGDTPLAPNHA